MHGSDTADRGWRSERRVDDCFADAQFAEGVRADAELAYASSAAGAGRGVRADLVSRLPEGGGAHELGEPVARLGALWRWMTKPAKLSAIDASNPGWPVSASMSAIDCVTTSTWPSWVRPRCSNASAWSDAVEMTAPNSSSTHVHNAGPRSCASTALAWMSLRMIAVTVLASSGITST